METLKSIVGLGSNTTTTANEMSGQEPVNGTVGSGTADQPYDSGNLVGPSTGSQGPKTASGDFNEQSSAAKQSAGAAGAEHPSSAPADEEDTAEITPLARTDTKASIWSVQDPFARRESVSGASKEVALDPKAPRPVGEEPIPEIESCVVEPKKAKPTRNPFSKTSHLEHSSNLANGSSTKVDKGKQKAAPPVEKPIEKPAEKAESISSASKLSQHTRTGSVATYRTNTASSATGVSTLGESSRRKSFVPTGQSNPARIPTAGGRPIGATTTGVASGWTTIENVIDSASNSRRSSKQHSESNTQLRSAQQPDEKTTSPLYQNDTQTQNNTSQNVGLGSEAEIPASAASEKTSTVKPAVNNTEPKLTDMRRKSSVMTKTKGFFRKLKS